MIGRQFVVCHDDDRMKHIVDTSLEYTTDILQQVIQEEEERFQEIQDMVLETGEAFLAETLGSNNTGAFVCKDDDSREHDARVIQQLCTRVAESDACVRYIDTTVLQQVHCQHARMRGRINALDLEAVSLQKEAQRLMQNNDATRHLLRDKKQLLKHCEDDIVRMKEEIYGSIWSSIVQQKRVDEAVKRVQSNTEQQPCVQRALAGLQNTLTVQSSHWNKKQDALCIIEKQKHEILRETNEMQRHIRHVCEALAHACIVDDQHPRPGMATSQTTAVLERIFHAVQCALKREEDLYEALCSSYRAVCSRIDGVRRECAGIVDRVDEISRQQHQVDTAYHAIKMDVNDMTSIHAETPMVRSDLCTRTPIDQRACETLLADITRLERELELELCMAPSCEPTHPSSTCEQMVGVPPRTCGFVHQKRRDVGQHATDNRHLQSITRALVSTHKNVALLQLKIDKTIRHC